MSKFKHTAHTLLLGCITGIISGGAVSLFVVCAKITLRFAFDIYSFADTALAVVCVIALVVLCCFITSVLQTLYPASRGSGIPLVEAKARGLIPYGGDGWFSAAGSLFAGSLLAFISGMPLGSEGPSIGIGGLIGEGIGKTAKAPTEVRRYLVTGGAGSGLAVAFNAPLTGLAFALEETHRRFTPGILLAAFSAVLPAAAVSKLIFWGLGHSTYLASLGIGLNLAVLPSLAQASFSGAAAFFAISGIAVLCGGVCAALAAAFNRAIFALGKLMGKIKFAPLRLLPAFALAAICGLSLNYSVGGGEYALHNADHNAALWLIFTLLAIRFITTATASGCGATGGLMMPILAIGGLIGSLASKAFIAAGVSAEYAPNITFICISAFFAASVRAPISAVCLSVELTASFTNLLPVSIGAAIAVAAVSFMRAEPLYEKMMKDLGSKAPNETAQTQPVYICGAVSSGSTVCGRLIRDVLWPNGSLVTDLERSGAHIVPDGETALLEGDIITVRSDFHDAEAFKNQMTDYISVNCKRNQ